MSYGKTKGNIVLVSREELITDNYPNILNMLGYNVTILENIEDVILEIENGKNIKHLIIDCYLTYDPFQSESNNLVSKLRTQSVYNEIGKLMLVCRDYDENTRKKGEVQSSDEQIFSENLTRVLTESYRVLKDEGLLIFS